MRRARPPFPHTTIWRTFTKGRRLLYRWRNGDLNQRFSKFFRMPSASFDVFQIVERRSLVVLWNGNARTRTKLITLKKSMVVGITAHRWRCSCSAIATLRCTMFTPVAGRRHGTEVGPAAHKRF